MQSKVDRNIYFVFLSNRRKDAPISLEDIDHPEKELTQSITDYALDLDTVAKLLKITFKSKNLSKKKKKNIKLTNTLGKEVTIKVEFEKDRTELFCYHNKFSELFGGKSTEPFTYSEQLTRFKYYIEENPTKNFGDALYTDSYAFLRTIKNNSEIDFNFFIKILIHYCEFRDEEKIKKLTSINPYNFRKLQKNENLEKNYYDILENVKTSATTNKKNFESISLLFVCYYMPESLDNVFLGFNENEKSELSNSIELIYSTDAYEYLDSSMDLNLFQYYNKFEQLGKSLKKYKNFAEALVTLIGNYNNLNKRINGLKVSDYFSPNDQENISSVFVELTIFLNKIDDAKSTFFLDLNDYIISYGEYYKKTNKTNMDKLLTLIKEYSKFIDICEYKKRNGLYFMDSYLKGTEQILKNLKHLYYESAEFLITQRILNNKDILEIILNRVLPLTDTKILKGIDFDQVDSSFFLTFKQIDWNTIFDRELTKNNYFAEVINKLKDFKDFYEYLPQLFSPCNTSKELIKLILKKFIELLGEYREDDLEIDLEIISKALDEVFRYHNLNKFYIPDTLCKEIEGNLSLNLSFNLHIYILQHGGPYTEQLYSIITKYLIKNSVHEDPKDTFRILSYYEKNNKKQIREFFENLEKFYIKEKDFFLPENTYNFSLLTLFIKDNFHCIYEYKTSKYFTYNLKKIQSNLDDLKKFNFYINDVRNLNLLNGENFHERLLVLVQNDESYADKLFKIYKPILKKFELYNKAVKQFLSYYQYYYYDDTQRIAFLDQLAKDVDSKTVDFLKKNEKKLEGYLDQLDEVILYNKFTQSKFFNNIYSNLKSEITDNDKRKKKAKNQFYYLINLLQEDTLTNIDPYLLYIAIQKNNEYNTILHEIRLLVDIFQYIQAFILQQDTDTDTSDNKKDSNSNQNETYEGEDSANTSNNAEVIEMIKNIDLDELSSNQNHCNNLAKKIYYFMNKKLIISLINTKLNLLSNFLPNGSDSVFYKKLLDLKDRIESEHFLKSLDVILMDLDYLCINILKRTKFITILEILSKDKEIIEFLKDKKVEEVKSLNDLIDEVHDETQKTYVNSSDIVSLTKVVEFLTDFGNIIIKQKVSDNKFFDLFKVMINDEVKYNKIEVDFNCVAMTLTHIKDLFIQFVDKSEFTKEKIKNIHKKSNFILFKNKNNNYECTVTYLSSDESHSVRESKFDDIIEMRNTSILKKKIEAKKDKKDDYEIIFDEFNDEVVSIENMLYYLDELTSKGYSIYENFDISIPEKINILNGQKLSDILQSLRENLESVANHITKAYEGNQIMTLIYGKQFTFLYEYLKNFISAKSDNKEKENENEKSNKKEDGVDKEKSVNASSKFDINKINFYYYIQYIVDKDKVILPNFVYSEPEASKGKSDQIALIELYFDKLLSANFINEESYFKENMIIEGQLNDREPLKSGIYFWYAEESQLESNIIDAYIYYTNHIPSIKVILLCTNESTPEEIKAFIYRFFCCKQRVLFSIINPEQLNEESQFELLDLLNNFKDKEENISSTLAIFHTEFQHTLIDQLVKLTMKGRKVIKFNKRGSKEVLFPAVTVITANKSGIGKSFYIKNNCKKNYIYFPLGGEFTYDELINRLLELNIKDNTVIHLDLKNTAESTYIKMKNFLFQFLIFNSFIYVDKIFCIKNQMKNKTMNISNFNSCNIEIKVELPTGFYDFRDKFQVLKLFKCIDLSKNPIVLINSFNDFNLQITLNYLNLIDKKTISSTNLKEENFERFDDKKAQGLLNKYIKISNPTYYQMVTFINVLAEQLKSFSNCPYLDVTYLKNNAKAKKIKNLVEIRKVIIESFINLTEYFTKGAFESILNKQELSVKAITGKYDEEKVQSNLIPYLSNMEEGLSFESVLKNHSVLFFNEDEYTISIISNDSESSEEYKNYRNLYNINNLTKEVYPLIDYKKLHEKKYGYLTELKKILDLKNPIDELEKQELVASGIITKDTPTLIEKIADYVFTADNFIKMVLILLRIRAKVPVVMMGETGCGKTALIKAIANLKGNPMKILNIHAGINDFKIIKWMTDNDLLEEDDGNKKSSSNTSTNKNEKIWIFFDEINTCNSMGLISEIMLNNTMNGKKLKNNIIFVAACNPYKIIKKEKNLFSEGLVNIRSKNTKTKLVYTVNPLPHCLLNFVLNFGSLKERDEFKYIQSMIRNPIANSFKNYRNSDMSQDYINNMIQLSLSLISKSQSFIRNNYGLASVSLRDISRFIILYDWFKEFLVLKKKLNLSFEYTNENGMKLKFSYASLSFHEIMKESIILSIYLCYFIRISDKNIKEQLENEMSCILKIFDNSSTVQKKSDMMIPGEGRSFIVTNEFLEVPFREENNLISYIKPPIGIAKNKALLRNIFTLFVCLNNKIPVFICGKPGCSKSLSVQLIDKAMEGPSSDEVLFRQFPRIVMNSYQGSETSTSEGVLKIFNKARGIIISRKEKKLKTDDILSTIYFDELGLAEISPNNPLKVLHSELEYNDNETKTAFIGISNWVLDASKMNRGIFLSIPEPDEKDLKHTAIIIAESYSENLGIAHRQLFESLASTYFEYKNYLKTVKTTNVKASNSRITDTDQEFHGSRDFYHLIKIAARKIQFNESRDIDAGIMSIERNFGGTKNGIQKVKQIFYKKYNMNENFKIDEYKVIDCIKENILDNSEDSLSRYLLIIAKGSLSPFILNNVLSEFKDKVLFYIGSKLEDDNSESYSAKILNKIQACMEEDKILIMKNLESIYPSLYDLFNQNFVKVGNRHYARIALGYSNTITALVNDKFRCIVLVDEKEIKNEQPPFLNRFEKHFISIENLIEEKYKEQSGKFYEDLFKNILTFNDSQMQIDLELDKELINCDKEETQGIFKLEQKSDENLGVDKLNSIQQKILGKIIPTFSQDIIAASYYSELFKKKQNLHKEIMRIYTNNHKNDINEYLESIDTNKCMIYTFSDYLQPLELKEKIENKYFGDFRKENIKEILVSKIKSEERLEKEINDFYDPKKNYKICIFRFKCEDCIHLNYVKFFIETYIKERNVISNEVDKIFVFILFIKRIIKHVDNPNCSEINQSELISHLTDFHQIFIDNINGIKYKINNVAKLYNCQPFKVYEEFLDFDQIIKDNLYSCFKLIKYNIKNKSKELKKVKDYSQYLMDKLLENQFIMDMIKFAIKNEIIKNNQNILLSLFKSFHKSYEISDSSIFDVLVRYLSKNYVEYLEKFIVKCEKDSIISPILFGKCSDCKQIETFIYDKYLKNYQFSPCKNTYESNEIDVIYGLNLPFILDTFININKSLSNYLVLYVENDNRLKYIYDETELQSFKETYEKTKQNFEKNTFRIIKNYESINYYLDDDNLINYLEEDYYKYFLVKNKEFSCLDNLSNIVKLAIDIQFQNDQYIKSQSKSEILARKILFIESYSQQIMTLVQIYKDILIFENKENKSENEEDNNEPENKDSQNLSDDEIDINITTTFDVIKHKCMSDEIKFEESMRNQSHKNNLNKPFYFILESLLGEIVKHLNDLSSISSNDFTNYIKFLKNIIQKASVIDSGLLLFSQELIIIKLFYNISELNANDPDTLQSIGKLIFEDKDHILNSEKENLTENLEEEFDILKKSFSNNKNYSDIMINFLIFKYNQYSDNEYRANIINLSTKDLRIIQGNFQKLLLTFFKNVTLSPPILDNSNEGRLSNDEEQEDNGGEECFLSFAKCDDQDLIISSLDNDCEYKDALYEQILFFFELKLKNFFDQLKKDSNFDDEKIFESSKIFENFLLAIECIEKLYLNDQNEKEKIELEDEEIVLPNLALLYSIAYIKVFLNIYVNLNYDENNLQEYNFTKMKNLFIDERDVNITLKIYIMKLFLRKFNNYSELSTFQWDYHLINWADEFIFHEANEQCKLSDFAFMSKNISKDLKNLDDYLLIDYNDPHEQIFEFFDISVNNYIYKLYYQIGANKHNTNLEDNYCAQHEYLNHCEKFKKELLDKKSGEFLFNFYNSWEYRKRFGKIVNGENFSKEDYIIFLYAYKFALACCFDINTPFVPNPTTTAPTNKATVFLNKATNKLKENLSFFTNNNNNSNIVPETENFFYNLFSPKLEETIRNSYIPGGEMKYVKKIFSYYQIKGFFKNNPNRISANKSSPGVYLCSCGEFYLIEDCSLPSITYKCIHCGNEIGGKKHKLVEREGHIRIFENESEEKYISGKIYCHLGKAYKFFNNFEKEIQNEIRANEIKGIINVPLNIFKKDEQKIRNLNDITHRLLNFVLYSIIYFAYVTEIISEDKTKEFFCILKDEENEGNNFNSSPFDFLKLNWNLLQKTLRQNNVEEIEIFLNLIFSNLNKLIYECGAMNTKDQRNVFEDNVNNIVLDIKNNYEKYSKEYLDKNYKYLHIDINSLKSIVEEIALPTIYDPKKYPYLPYFMYSPLPHYEVFVKDFDNLDNKNKFPTIENYILKKDEIKNMVYLLDINKFANEMNSRYSYKITRKEAKDKNIKSILQEERREQELNNNEFIIENGEKITLLEKNYNKYEASMNDLKSLITKYRCQPEMKEHDFSRNDSISFCLCDDGESGNGMYLAAAYYNFILWQNSFINSVKDSIFRDNKLLYMRPQLEKGISVNSANENDIISITFDNDLLYKDIYDIVCSYSHRNCFRNDKTKNNSQPIIDYSKYKEIYYDYKSIEEELIQKLISGKKLFDEKINMVTYRFEENLGDNSKVFVEFLDKYTQKDFDDSEKMLINDFIVKGSTADTTKSLSSIKLIILYLKDNDFNTSDTIIDVIKSMPKMMKIEDKLTTFFESNKNLKVENLIEILNYFEFIAFDDILVNVDNLYKKDLPSEKKTKINNYFALNNSPETIITKKELAVALRRYISRFLAGLRFDTIEIPEKKMIDFLGRREFWPDKYFSNDKMFDTFQAKLVELSNEFQILFQEAVKFYEFLGGEEKTNRKLIDKRITVKQETHNEKPIGKVNHPKNKPKKYV